MAFTVFQYLISFSSFLDLLNYNVKLCSSSIFIQLTPLLELFSGRLHQVPKQPKLSLSICILQFFPHYFFWLFILTHPVNFPCGKKPENRLKIMQSVDELFVRSDVRYRARTHYFSGGRASLRLLSHRRPTATGAPKPPADHCRFLNSDIFERKLDCFFVWFLCVDMHLVLKFSIYINEMVMPVKYKGMLIVIFGIYTFSNPEDAGSIPSLKALELHFWQLVPVWVLECIS